MGLKKTRLQSLLKNSNRREAGISQAAEKLIQGTKYQGFVKGHDFTAC
jgi:hypothetical protein